MIPVKPGQWRMGPPVWYIAQVSGDHVLCLTTGEESADGKSVALGSLSASLATVETWPICDVLRSIAEKAKRAKAS